MSALNTATIPLMENHQPDYSFITNPAKPAKKSLLPTGGSQKSRLVIVLGGLFGLIILAVIVMAVISSIGSGEKQQWLKLAQEQQELIRISEIGSQKAQNRDTKNLAITTKLSLTSSQSTINSLAKKNGAQVDSKSLALGRDSKTDAILKTAEQTNQFDKVFAEVLKTKLTTYQSDMKKLYEGTASAKTKASLASAYTNAGVLVTEANR